ncbi:MAG TPA: hypothetical protein VHJ55_11405 [Casimicrobiaceae bacterium]|nr:hypothetical protein [Casimicrobiaceae bacterium]
MQAFPSGSNSTLVFAVNTYPRFSNATASEWDIAIDIDGDGVTDFFVVGLDVARVISSKPSGRLVSIVVNARTNAIVDPVRFADVATDNTFAAARGPGLATGLVSDKSAVQLSGVCIQLQRG